MENCGDSRGFDFIYLSNVDVENCGENRGFGFIYILVANPCDAREMY